MKTLFKLFSFSLLLFFVSLQVEGQVVTKEEANIIARNWVQMIIDQFGTWGKYNTATPRPVISLEHEGQKIGYLSHVIPAGYIVISIRKELSPVKMYSTSDNYYSETEDCLPDFIIDFPKAVLDKIETDLAPVLSVSSIELKSFLEIDYSEAWNNVYNYMAQPSKKITNDTLVYDNYQQGDFLLKSNWWQKYPYNSMCPDLGCTGNYLYGRALVGCVAIAAGQLMNYWNWPPYGTDGIYEDYYNWPSINDTVTENSTQTEIDAVAELCAEIGNAISMDWGCSSSGAFIKCQDWYPTCWGDEDLETRLHTKFRYSDDFFERNDYSADTWFEGIKWQINHNRPIIYGLKLGGLLSDGHAVVVDGWQEIGNPVIMQYHINFGWKNFGSGEPCWPLGMNSNTWYTLDEIPCFNDEEMLVDVVPEQDIGIAISGNYPKEEFPYRYIALDASGSNAVFEGGQNIQFFQGRTLTCNGSQSVDIQGGMQNETFLFTRGDRSKGLRVDNGSIKLYNQGSIKFH